MSLRATQNFLARIYTDEDLRRAFLSAPERVGRENGLSEAESGELARILPEELNFFAESLFYKRLREVEKLLPLTRGHLGDDFETHFRDFATLHTPKTIKKHLEDAIKFVDHARSGGEIEPAWVVDVARFEQSRLLFLSGEKRLHFLRLNYDIRRILKLPAHGGANQAGGGGPVAPPERKTYGLWLRFRGGVKQFIW